MTDHNINKSSSKSHKVNICEIFNPLLKQHGGASRMHKKSRSRRLLEVPNATYPKFQAIRIQTDVADGVHSSYNWIKCLPPINEDESKFYKQTAVVSRPPSQPKLSSEYENENKFCKCYEGTWLAYLPGEILDYILKLKHQMVLNELNKEYLGITALDIGSEKYLRIQEMRGYRFIRKGGYELRRLRQISSTPAAVARAAQCNYAITVEYRAGDRGIHYECRAVDSRMHWPKHPPLFNIYNYGMFLYSIGNFQHFRNKPRTFNDVLGQRHGITHQNYDSMNNQFGLGPVSSWGHPSSSRWCSAEKFREHFKHLGIKGFSQLRKADLVRLYFTEDIKRKKIGEM